MHGHFDIVVVGAGIAGASAAYELAADRRTLLLERESVPGYHATGRSAAIFLETYGNAVVRALTAASRAFLEAPPPGFSATSLVQPRGSIFVADRSTVQTLRDHYAAIARPTTARWLEGAALHDLVPVLRPEVWCAGIYEPDALDIDVNALHQGFLSGFRIRGGVLQTDAELTAARWNGGRWDVETRRGSVTADLLVDAAGAWADDVAALANVTSLRALPLRRTAITVDAPPDVMNWPYVGDLAETFYFKPEGGRLMATPCDESALPPCDVQPDELDVAFTVQRLQGATTLSVARIYSRRAGFRTFVADRSPVAGFDTAMPSFFWLVGQGGYGIQTSPALASLTRSLIVEDRVPDRLLALGISRHAIGPGRLEPDRRARPERITEPCPNPRS